MAIKIHVGTDCKIEMTAEQFKFTKALLHIWICISMSCLQTSIKTQKLRQKRRITWKKNRQKKCWRNKSTAASVHALSNCW